jgi:hypothetical protein
MIGYVAVVEGRQTSKHIFPEEEDLWIPTELLQAKDVRVQSGDYFKKTVLLKACSNAVDVVGDDVS